MNKEFLIKLTADLYRLTLLFPKKEPLRYKIRELADDTLAKPKAKDLEILDSFFEVAKSQNWVSLSNILEVQKEYSKIREELKQSLDVQPRKVGRVEETIPGRQQKILEVLKEKGRVQVGEIQKIFPEVTKRTLRRDFESLLNQDLIERMGERNETFYQIKEGRS